MTPDDVSLTWGEIISFFGVMLTLISLLGGVIFALYRNIRSVKTDLDAHKLEVATRYVQSEHLNSFKEDMIRSETRTLSAIQGLAERFDRFLTKQDN